MALFVLENMHGEIRADGHGQAIAYYSIGGPGGAPLGAGSERHVFRWIDIQSGAVVREKARSRLTFNIDDYVAEPGALFSILRDGRICDGSRDPFSENAILQLEYTSLRIVARTPLVMLHDEGSVLWYTAELPGGPLRRFAVLDGEHCSSALAGGLVVARAGESLSAFSIDGVKRWTVPTVSSQEQQLRSHKIDSESFAGENAAFIVTCETPSASTRIIARDRDTGDVRWMREVPANFRPIFAIGWRDYAVLIAEIPAAAPAEWLADAFSSGHAWFVWNSTGQLMARRSAPCFREHTDWRSTEISMVTDTSQDAMVVGAGIRAHYFSEGVFRGELRDLPGRPVLLENGKLVCEDSHAYSGVTVANRLRVQ